MLYHAELIVADGSGARYSCEIEATNPDEAALGAAQCFPVSRKRYRSILFLFRYKRGGRLDENPCFAAVMDSERWRQVLRPLDDVRARAEAGRGRRGPAWT